MFAVNGSMRTKPAHWRNVTGPIDLTFSNSSRDLNGPFSVRYLIMFSARLALKPAMCLHELEWKRRCSVKARRLNGLRDQLPQQSHAGCIQIDADKTHAFHDHLVQRFGQQFLVDIVLIHTDSQVFSINFNQLSQWVTQTTCNRSWMIKVSRRMIPQNPIVDLPALIKFTSNVGNSLLATSLQEYIEAPHSLTMQYLVELESRICWRISSVIHDSVSRQAVPLPSAINSHLSRTEYENKTLKNSEQFNGKNNANYLCFCIRLASCLP